MNDKKNIDRLFQERFKDFEITPDEAVWAKIKAHQKKQEKRVLLIPIWYKTAGVAALIAIIFGISYSYLSLSPQNDTIITNSNTKKRIEKTPNDYFKPISSEKNRIVTEEKETNNNTIKAKAIEPNQNPEMHPHNNFKPFVTKENSVAKTSKQTSPQPKKNENLTSIPSSIYKDQITDNTAFTQEHNITKQIDPLQNAPPSTNKKKTNETNVIAGYQNKDLKSEKEHPLFITPNKSNNSIDTTDIVEKNIVKNDTENSTTEENLDQKNKKSIFDAINHDEEELPEEAIAIKKWNITPNIAPVYYNTTGNGSSIDAQFADNEKKGEINMSYGIQVSYAINKKISVRSGINKVAFSYNTKDVGFTPSRIAQHLGNINYNTSSDVILISDVRDTETSEPLDFTSDAINQKQNVGLLNQSIEYIEVPMEMKYALITKKIGVNIIGGISTLFLQNNSIAIKTGSLETPIGNANNLNSTSFSGNIGLGIGYQISDQLEASLEPIFKYQFNAFNNNTGNFKPYYFGIYTGISIKF